MNTYLGSTHIKTGVKSTILVISTLIVVAGVSDWISNSFQRRQIVASTITYPSLAPPGQNSSGLETISLQNIQSLQEIAVRSQNEERGAVAIAETKSPDVLQFVFADGIFIRWDVVRRKDILKQRLFSLQDGGLPVY